MLTRRDFIQKSAAVAGSLMGFDQMVVLAQDHPAPTGPYTIRTSLAFADFERINRILREVNDFGSPEPYRGFSSPLYRSGMTLIDLTRRYVQEVRATWPLPRSGTYPPVRPHPMATAARHCDAHLELLSLLLVMMNNEIIAFDAREHTYMNTAAQAGEFARKFTDLRNAALHIAEQWRLGTFNFINISPTDRQLKLERFYEGGPRINIYQSGISILSNPQNIDIHYMYTIIGWVKDGLDQIYTQRAIWKAIYSAYSMLSILELECRAQSTGAESMNGGTVSRGGRQFVNKVLLGFLFVEIVLTRIRLLAHRARSGVFTDFNRNGFQNEAARLVGIIDTGLQSVRFGRIQPFDGRFSSSPVVVPLEGRNIRLTVPDLGTNALGLTRAGRVEISVSAYNRTSHAMQTCDTALERLRNERARLLGSLEGK